MTDKDARNRLLVAAVDYVARHGVTDLSLRQLAAGLGTSHRMLIYHFGSREGLFVEVIRYMEAGQREVLAELRRSVPADASPAEVARLFWRRVSDPALWPHERLFFELYGQALQGRPGTTALLDDVIDAWIAPVVEFGVAHGLRPQEARVHARLGVAVTRGLLLDLLTTGDRDTVDVAMERYIAGYQAAFTR